MAKPARDPDGKLLVTLTADELGQIVDDRVRAAVRDEVEKLCEPRFLTAGDVAEMLQVCTKTVANLVRKEGLPVARQLGRELRFERDQVVEWMRERVGTEPPPARPRLVRKHLERVK
jgi:excisionase family DNA binding protein